MGTQSLYGSEVWAPNPYMEVKYGHPILLYGSEVWAPNPYMEVKYGHPILIWK